MALVYADRVQEVSTTTGTGAFTLSGASTSYRTFASGVGNTNETFYSAVNSSTGEWEVGRGTVGVGTLSRDTILASSNSNLVVSFSAGSKTIFAVSPAQFFTNALDSTAHAAINHTGLPGVPAAEAFTSSAHDGVDHTSAPFNLLDAAAHSGIDHTGFTGIINPKPTPVSWGATSGAMVGDITLTDTDDAVQILDPDGSDRLVTLPANATTNPFFYIANVGVRNNTITVRSPSSDTLAVLGYHQAVRCYSDGIEWTVQGKASVDTPASLTNGFGFVVWGPGAPRQPFYHNTGISDPGDQTITVPHDCEINTILSVGSTGGTLTIYVNGVSAATPTITPTGLVAVQSISPISLSAGDYLGVGGVSAQTVIELTATGADTGATVYASAIASTGSPQPLTIWGEANAAGPVSAVVAEGAIMAPVAFNVTNASYDFFTSSASGTVRVYVDGAATDFGFGLSTRGVVTVGSPVAVAAGELLALGIQASVVALNSRVGALIDYPGTVIPFGGDVTAGDGFLLPLRSPVTTAAVASSPATTATAVVRRCRLDYVSANYTSTSFADLNIYVDGVLTATLNAAHRVDHTVHNACYWELKDPIELSPGQVIEVQTSGAIAASVSAANVALWCADKLV